MVIKKLHDLSIETLLHFTLKCSTKLPGNPELWHLIHEMWCYIAVLPSGVSERYYSMFNTYLHVLSHDCKSQVNDDTGLMTLSADDVFNLLVTCQSPRVIFNYRLKRQRLTPCNTLHITEKLCLKKYFYTKLVELDISGADFCCDDTLLVNLLPQCRVLQILCLGNSGSRDVLDAAKHCPLTKLQLEERCPLTPKLPQDVVLHYLLGFVDGSARLHEYLELCKRQTQLNQEDSPDDKTVCSEFLKSLPEKCSPTWPNLRSLIFGNCRLCREALLLCLLVLKNLQEISIHRIQSDEILNTCERLFDALGLRFQISLKQLNLWAGWAGFRNNTLKMTPNAIDLSVVASGYSRLNLQETVESNSSLLNIRKLRLVGIRNAGPDIFNNSTSQLSKIASLELSGSILTTEELVNIFTCFHSMTAFQIDYSELRNYNYNIVSRRYPKNCPLKSFSLETSFIDYDCLRSLFLMTPNVRKLSIRGKTKNFSLSFALQQLFLFPGAKIDTLELYPLYPLDITCLVNVANSFYNSHKRLTLKIPLGSITKRDYAVLSQSGWTIFPCCSRC